MDKQHINNTVACNFVVDFGNYKFPDQSTLEKFLKNPIFTFDFQPSNVDDKDGMRRIFGSEGPIPIYPSGMPEFNVTHIQKSEDDEDVVIVSVGIPMEFEIITSEQDFLEWVESDTSAWKYTGRIVCEGEDGLLDAEREEYEFDI
jgi:hypothetical protein